MSTCGYVCPSCGGGGFDAEGDACDWCNPEGKGTASWSSPHSGSCCADVVEEDDK
jgi:hypothetical protein